jgi:hypothetical protein
VLHSPLLDGGRVFAARAVLLRENLPSDSFCAFTGDELLECRQASFCLTAKLDRDFDALLPIGGAEQLVLIDGDRAFECDESVGHVGVLDSGKKDFGKSLEG